MEKNKEYKESLIDEELEGWSSDWWGPYIVGRRMKVYTTGRQYKTFLLMKIGVTNNLATRGDNVYELVYED